VRDTLGEFEHQVLLAILRLGEEAYSVPILRLLKATRQRLFGLWDGLETRLDDVS